MDRDLFLKYIVSRDIQSIYNICYSYANELGKGDEFTPDLFNKAQRVPGLIDRVYQVAKVHFMNKFVIITLFKEEQDALGRMVQVLIKYY